MLLRGGGQIDDGGDALHRLSPHRGLVSGARVDRAPQIDRAAFDGDLHHACTAPDDPEACGRNFLGDYIAVASTNGKAQALWTGNGAQGMDVFSGRATFGP